LETIADYDRIVVMNEGQVAEYDSPYELLQRTDGLFRALVDQLGPEVRASFQKTTSMRHEAAYSAVAAEHEERIQ
jgi:ABC-type proline/glycine betaine transport system ATPase subunit